MITFHDISQKDCIRGPGKIDARGYCRKSRFNKVYFAHRLAYSDTNGGIPAGYHVHHLCDNKACINPKHLVALTPAEHRDVHTSPKAAQYYADIKVCKQGHPLDGKSSKQRYCKTCHNAIGASYQARPEIKEKYRELYKKRKAAGYYV